MINKIKIFILSIFSLFLFAGNQVVNADTESDLKVDVYLLPSDDNISVYDVYVENTSNKSLTGSLYLSFEPEILSVGTPAYVDGLADFIVSGRSDNGKNLYLGFKKFKANGSLRARLLVENNKLTNRESATVKFSISNSLLSENPDITSKFYKFIDGSSESFLKKSNSKIHTKNLKLNHIIKSEDVVSLEEYSKLKKQEEDNMQPKEVTKEQEDEAMKIAIEKFGAPDKVFYDGSEIKPETTTVINEDAKKDLAPIVTTDKPKNENNSSNDESNKSKEDELVVEDSKKDKKNYKENEPVKKGQKANVNNSKDSKYNLTKSDKQKSTNRIYVISGIFGVALIVIGFLVYNEKFKK